ncbi:hypothetical protein HJA87_22605 [Rhizobium bangladeshense]|uniref:Uncharacterized protein n=1 Tax=Rhizobium bangladeshense TaxID=1138189 RepID=A0ABS7LME8_9HYPH|nr:hypothetical protein [Rhizobium bangladeshense]MBX4874720.1 hypothetical protein [Rhizobium bangladeshense]MBX4885239.1 hypothetical protein [Rhizobium bangladeshense]MBX4899166.1 hypothetical protein [Rhizobium bangladeshense]MBX4932108.1 hypothetical protein [Rhizobium bangladeshense]MBY3592649.1 hypothetical protein [Rhizobium bangladeshense]
MPDPNKTPAAPPRRYAELRADPYAGQSGDLSLNNAIRAIARGTHVGAYLDEANAGTAALLAPVFDPMLPDGLFPPLPGGTLAERYENALAIQRGMDKAFDDQHPYISTILQGAGELASDAAFKLPSGMTMSMAEGAVEGFGSGEGGFSNRLQKAFDGAAEEALTEFGMNSLKRRGLMPSEAGPEGGRNAGAKALKRALLRARSRSGGGGW